MVDHVILKRLTERSDLGWFHSIHDNRGLPGHQKGINLNKPMVNTIWPNLMTRQVAYEAAKAAEAAARLPGGAGAVAAAAERATAQEVGHLRIRVEVHGPDNRPPIIEDRLLALQDKNWRLNGAFIEDSPGDAARFDPTLQEGDLALIGFDGVEWPTRAVVVLLAHSTADAALMADLSPLVTKGARSMARLSSDDLQTFADNHGLPDGHVIRTLAGDPVIKAALEEIAQGDIASVAKIRMRRPSRQMTPEELAAGIAENTRIGQLGERMVNAYLAEKHATGGLAYVWMWPTSAAHPYDFALLNHAIVDTVIDAKSTSSEWKANFYMSMAELEYAANSSVPYLIFRLSEVGPMGAWLRMSHDIRAFATAVASSFAVAAPTGTRATTIAISPVAAGLAWSDPPVRLPPGSP